ncbi:hypothetical protein NSA56_11300 [Oceanobacillus caeni]|uniref:hypothetical protein n=1 Tax=Oceanobacillus caeni TaxID=405946 RepID=UPI002149DE25|nr:hypothetical protein [Oceanobacillus caeni]MCR1834981.1 hypothetical protein [Oceanobacillus caeni]
MKLLAILLTVLFVALKITSYIEWSWFWVFSPAWIFVIWIIFLCFIIGLDTVMKDKKR